MKYGNEIVLIIAAILLSIHNSRCLITKEIKTRNLLDQLLEEKIPMEFLEDQQSKEFKVIKLKNYDCYKLNKCLISFENDYLKVFI